MCVCRRQWHPTPVLLPGKSHGWRSNQSILKEISPGCSLEGMMLKLKLQFFGHLMRRVDSLEKTLMLGGIGGRRRRGQQRMRWLDGITDLMDEFEWTPGDGDGQGGLGCYSSWGRRELDTTERLNWTECMYVNSNPLNYSACIWRTTGTPGPLWRHTACYILPALSVPGHCKPIRLQGRDTSLIFFLIFKIYFSWKISTLQYWMIFVVHQDESATGIHVSPHPESPLPSIWLWVVPEYQLWVPCFVHRTWAGCLFYTW